VSRITAHVLDIALGRPARDLLVRLAVMGANDQWQLLAEGATNEEGRVLDLSNGAPIEARVYRLTFETGAYFEASRRSTFYPYVEVVFQVRAPSEHHHVPLLLSPYGYSTYRGS
jgi:5-hydroxyisourate hydrolase